MSRAIGHKKYNSRSIDCFHLKDGNKIVKINPLLRSDPVKDDKFIRRIKSSDYHIKKYTNLKT